MKITVFSICLVLGAGLLLAEASGQRTTTRKKNTPQVKSPDTGKTRARRAVAPAAEELATNSTPTPATDIVQPDQNTSAKPAPAPKEPAGIATTPTDLKSNAEPSTSPIDRPSESTTSVRPAADLKNPSPTGSGVSLRDQIDAAPNAQERIRLQLQLVDHLVTSGNKSEALAELETIFNTAEFDPQGLYNVGNSFARLGDTDGAIKAYRKAIAQRNGRYSRAFNNLGVVLLRAGRWDEAYDALLSALKLESFRYMEASYNLGRLYAARGQVDLAIREWRRVLAADPEHTAAKHAISSAGSEGRIVVENQRQAPSRPRNKAVEVEKPVSAVSSERPVNTKTSPPARPSKPLAIDQTSYDFLQRARTSSERGNHADAIDNYSRIIARQGGYFPPANLELSYALLGLRQYDEALLNLLQVANRDGARYPVSYYHLARVYELKGELKLAETSFSQAATAYGPSNTQFLLDLSRVREKQSNFKGALEAMERYVDLMKTQGQSPAWSDERLVALRQKVSATVK